MNKQNTSGHLYDNLARAFMDTRPDLRPMSLDEWIIENAEQLDEAERKAGAAIMALHESKNQ